MASCKNPPTYELVIVNVLWVRVKLFRISLVLNKESVSMSIFSFKKHIPCEC